MIKKNTEKYLLVLSEITTSTSDCGLISKHCLIKKCCKPSLQHRTLFRAHDGCIAALFDYTSRFRSTSENGSPSPLFSVAGKLKINWTKTAHHTANKLHQTQPGLVMIHTRVVRSGGGWRRNDGGGKVMGRPSPNAYPWIYHCSDSSTHVQHPPPSFPAYVSDIHTHTPATLVYVCVVMG